MLGNDINKKSFARTCYSRYLKNENSSFNALDKVGTSVALDTIQWKE
jgi:hypothetical protein